MSTPQDIALKDAVKGIQMFRKVDVPVCRAVGHFGGNQSHEHTLRFWA